MRLKTQRKVYEDRNEVTKSMRPKTHRKVYETINEVTKIHEAQDAAKSL